jgi:hypothetical protein
MQSIPPYQQPVRERLALSSSVQILAVGVFAVLIGTLIVPPESHAQWWNFWGGKRGSGKIISGERELPAFTDITVIGSGDVFVQQGTQQKVRVEVDDNLMDDVETNVENGKLRIGMQKGSYSNMHLKVFITVPILTGLHISGSGDITVQSPFAANDMDISISGSGDVRLTGGKAQSLNVGISGSGDVEASNFEADNVRVRISGSGDCRVYAKSSLDARVSGSGDISYRGSPAQVSKSVTGSGSVRQKN